MREAKKGGSFEHYSPELVEAIRRKAESTPTNAENWATPNRLTKTLRRKVEQIMNLARELSKEHPEWFHDYQGYSRISEHFSPALIQTLRDEIASYTPAPHGWITNLSLYRKTKKPYKELLSIAGEYRSDHPGWFGEFLNAGGALFEYYSPELIEEIKKRILG